MTEFRQSVVLTDDGAEHVYAIPESGTQICRVMLQVVGADPGGPNTITLEGCVGSATTYVNVGFTTAGVLGVLSADGILFYERNFPIKLQVRYTLAATGVVTLYWMGTKAERLTRTDY